MLFYTCVFLTIIVLLLGLIKTKSNFSVLTSLCNPTCSQFVLILSLSHLAALDIHSLILSGHPNYYKSLKQMLAPVQVPGTRWERCYRGSEKSFRARSFHSLCDNIGPTVTLVQANQSVFGGYADKSWNSSSKIIYYCGFLFLRI